MPVPRRYEPLTAGLGDLAAALLMAPRLARRNQLEEDQQRQHRDDRQSEQDQRMLAAMRGEDTAMRNRKEDKQQHFSDQVERENEAQVQRDWHSAENEKNRKLSEALMGEKTSSAEKVRADALQAKDDAEKNKPVTGWALHDLNDRIQEEALSKGLMAEDQNTHKIRATPDTQKNPAALDQIRNKTFIGAGYNPTNYRGLSDKNPFEIVKPADQAADDNAFIAEQRGMQQAPQAAPSPPAPVADAPTDDTDLLGNPMQPQAPAVPAQAPQMNDGIWRGLPKGFGRLHDADKAAYQRILATGDAKRIAAANAIIGQ